MPLFHIHGLIAGVLAPLGGGRGLLHAGLQRAEVLRLDGRGRPTWYTAVPTMHQAILMRAERKNRDHRANPLRFIRSSSASLPPQVMRARGGVRRPLIESYGMTEAAHQMASNPLPPAVRKPGSGRASPPGPRSRSWTRTAMLLPRATGEVVIRGPNVTAGYENNPKANAEGFTNGWFRTGDQGVMDEEGYLSHHRPAEGDHQPRRREGQPARGRRDADGPPGGGAGGDLRHAARQARRGGRRRRGAARGQARPSASCATSSPARWPTSRCRARSCSWTRSPRAPPASCSASGWRPSSV
jgi:hypothetical protein